MLKRHQELLEAIAAAEQKARGLYAAGAQVDQIAIGLRDLGAQVKDRIRSYQASAPKAARSVSDAPPGGG